MLFINLHKTTNEDKESAKDRPGVLLEAVTVHGRGSSVEGVRRGADLQRLGQTPVSLQGGTLLVTLKPKGERKDLELFICSRDLGGVKNISLKTNGSDC